MYCKKRKTKCNETNPCETCQKAGQKCERPSKPEHKSSQKRGHSGSSSPTVPKRVQYSPHRPTAAFVSVNKSASSPSASVLVQTSPDLHIVAPAAPVTIVEHDSLSTTKKPVSAESDGMTTEVLPHSTSHISDSFQEVFPTPVLSTGDNPSIVGAMSVNSAPVKDSNIDPICVPHPTNGGNSISTPTQHSPVVTGVHAERIRTTEKV